MTDGAGRNYYMYNIKATHCYIQITAVLFDLYFETKMNIRNYSNGNLGITPPLNKATPSRIDSRDSNLELLRIFAMLLIVSHHFAVHSGIFSVAESNSSKFLSILWAQFLAYGGKIGVDIFVLISGYFLVKSAPKLSALLKLVITTFTYSAGLFLIFYLCGKTQPLGLRDTLKIFLPVSLSAYWFISCYISLYIISPFLNKLIFNLNKQQLGILIFILAILIAVPLFCPYFKAPLLTFVTLYLVAAYIRLYGDTIQKKWVVLTAIGCPLLMLVYILSVDIASLFFLHKGFRLYFLAGGNSSPLVILFSASMLLLFRELKIGTRPWINRFAAATLGIYLIHDNRFVRPWLWYDIFGVQGNFESLPFLQFAIFSVFVIVTVYFACTAADILREKLMALLFNWLTTKTKAIDSSIKAFFA